MAYPENVGADWWGGEWAFEVCQKQCLLNSMEICLHTLPILALTLVFPLPGWHYSKSAPETPSANHFMYSRQ